MKTKWDDAMLNKIIVSHQALREALSFESSTDAQLRKSLCESGLTEAWFRDFGKSYSVTRNLLRETRPQALQLIAERLVSPLQSGMRLQPDDIDRVAEAVAAAGHTKQGRGSRRPDLPRSLVSKIAALCRPDVFVPLDSYARMALKSAGYELEDASYRAFHTAAQQAFEAAEHALAGLCAAKASKVLAASVGVDPTLIDEGWFLRRVFDWELWLRGKDIRELRRSNRRRTTQSGSQVQQARRDEGRAHGESQGNEPPSNIQAVVRTTGKQYADGTPIWFVAIPKSESGPLRLEEDSYRDLTLIIGNASYTVRLRARRRMPSTVWFQKIENIAREPVRLTDVLREQGLGPNHKVRFRLAANKIWLD